MYNYYYYQYGITKEGDFVSESGHVVKWAKDNIHIKLNIEGKIKELNGLNLLYEIYNQKKITKKYYVYFKDGNPKNRSKKNLCVKQRDYSFTKERKFTPEIVEEIQRLYGKERLGEENKLVRSEIRKTLSHPSHSYRELATLYDCSVSVIERIVQGSYVKKEG